MSNDKCEQCEIYKEKLQNQRNKNEELNDRCEELVEIRNNLTKVVDCLDEIRDESDIPESKYNSTTKKEMFRRLNFVNEKSDEAIELRDKP